MDKTSKRILKHLCKQKCGTEYVCLYSPRWQYFFERNATVEQLAKDLQLSTSDLKAVVRFLEEAGYLEYQWLTTNGTNNKIGFCLSHKGLHWKYFRRKDILAYVAEKWPDFIAVVISIISLITAIWSSLH